MAGQVGVLARSGHHQHAPVDVEDVDVMPVEVGEDVAANHLLGSPADGVTGGKAGESAPDPSSSNGDGPSG